ncbi:MAG TPA: type II 3-dehydroquinate dehydratase [Candidatus Kapabacteria bacterium]|nr:type II 3-dehydroquinate dehydratase [Candidatus Kapabacteria bacterium]
MNILILHGPNLNLLGEREPEVYGYTTLSQINGKLYDLAKENGADIRCFQSNHEGVLIDCIHEFRKWAHACIINPGAFTHYSYALRDAVAAFNKPTVEVHLSDLSKRESFRQNSVLEGLPNVSRIMGKGAEGYYEALVELCKQ